MVELKSSIHYENVDLNEFVMCYFNSVDSTSTVSGETKAADTARWRRKIY